MANHKTRFRKRKSGYTITVEEYGADLAVIFEKYLRRNGVPYNVFEKSKGLLGSILHVEYFGPTVDEEYWDYAVRKIFSVARSAWKYGVE